MEQLENLLRLPWPWGPQYEEAERRLNSPMSDVTWGGLTRKIAASRVVEQKTREANWRRVREAAAEAVAEALAVDVARGHKLMAATASLTRMRAPDKGPEVLAPLWWKLIRFAQEGGTVTA